MDMIMVLLPAFVMVVLMTITHAYLGLHVLSRGIIFVDLALAQVAGLGVSFAFLFDYPSGSIESQLITFAATLIAAIAFTGLHTLPNKTAREVTIGIIYVVSTALTLLILSQTSQGMEELKSLMNGNILWVNWQELIFVTVAYGLLVIFHLVFRKQFYQVSFKQDESGSPKIIWELLFFVSFAIVITLAVNIAGILMVFAFLIIPAFSATLLMTSFISRLIVAGVMAVAASMLGLWLSYSIDLPIGATIVVSLGCLPLSALLMKFYIGRLRIDK